MGKRVKKKSRATTRKDKRAVSNSSKTVAQPTGRSIENVSDIVAESEDKKFKSCPHLEKGVDLKSFSEKIGSLNPSRCEDCREGVADRRGAKKGKVMKKKGNAFADVSKAIWVCLQCGYLACGGVGLPGSHQSHAVRHARLTRHPLVIQWDNSRLLWCFQCNTLIPAEKVDGNAEKRYALLDAVKLIKSKTLENSSVDIVDVWFGGGGAVREVTTDCTLSGSLERTDGYVVRGLTNLGNTCFLNSVVQNLLVMGSLRDYFLNQDVSFGPLSMAMKKLFSETRSDTGLRNVINPRSLFGYVCSKAPRFRGYQQQDSHELLCCLLDGLSTEELAVKKQLKASDKDGISRMHDPTFVDSAFGGQISSTVTCLECGHSSTVYEPFLDLSLPVPTKKPPAKRVQPVSQAKKTKLPPKRGGRIKPKSSKDTDIEPDVEPALSVSGPSVSESPSQTQSTVPLRDNAAASLGDNVLDSIGPTNLLDRHTLAAEDLSALPKSDNQQFPSTMEQTADSSVESSWTDYIALENVDELEFAPQNDLSISPYSIENNITPNDAILDDNQVSLANEESILKPDSSSVNPWEEEVPLQVASSEVLLLPYKEERFAQGEVTRGEAEASSSVLGNAREEGDFVGFGDLFNEPEVSTEPVSGPSYGDGVAETAFIGGNGSHSDPDEVDDTDSPVSVESCLVHFIKPELLSNDNAWECENCSRVLQHQQLELEKKKSENASDSSASGGKTEMQICPLNLDQDISHGVRDQSNGDANTSTSLDCIGESLGLNNGGSDCVKHSLNTEIGGPCEPNLSLVQCEREVSDMDVIVLEQSPYSGCCGLSSPEKSHNLVVTFCVDKPCRNRHPTSKYEQRSRHLSGNCEPGDNEDQHRSSKQGNVKRDATKMVLIDKAPSILTVHLKRFSQNARGRFSKLKGHVNFGEMLDLRPYMDPRCIDKEKYGYRLLGLVEHSGSMGGGHYVAYVRGGRSKGKTENVGGESVWYLASDAFVREVTVEEVLRSEAYILFYEKV